MYRSFLLLSIIFIFYFMRSYISKLVKSFLLISFSLVIVFFLFFVVETQEFFELLRSLYSFDSGIGSVLGRVPVCDCSRILVDCNQLNNCVFYFDVNSTTGRDEGVDQSNINQCSIDQSDINQCSIDQSNINQLVVEDPFCTEEGLKLGKLIFDLSVELSSPEPDKAKIDQLCKDIELGLSNFEVDNVAKREFISR